MAIRDVNIFVVLAIECLLCPFLLKMTSPDPAVIRTAHSADISDPSSALTLNAEIETISKKTVILLNKACTCPFYC